MVQVSSPPRTRPINCAVRRSLMKIAPIPSESLVGRTPSWVQWRWAATASNFRVAAAANVSRTSRVSCRPWMFGEKRKPRGGAGFSDLDGLDGGIGGRRIVSRVILGRGSMVLPAADGGITVISW